MKKFMIFLTAGLFMLAMNLTAQEFYLGAEAPDDYTPVKTEAQKATMGGIECPFCALDEGEGDIPDGGEDNTNGGCNSTPPVFSPISIGDVYCGRTNTYDVSGSDIRDTDWYKIVLAETKTLYWTSMADCELNIFIISDDGNCGINAVVAFDQNVPPGTQGQTSYTCGPGTWYFWVGHPYISGLPDGADYMVTLSEGPPPDPWCSGTPMPVSDWAIYIGVFLILVFMAIRFRRIF
ncbi:MAG: hypothetical protein U5Q03_02035 [Bacteroidota bacterium]|nr:hypothetical protein [Bacteroidota bacterium]